MFEQFKKIASERGQTVKEAAAECGVSHWQVRRILARDCRGSEVFWDRMIRWSGGRITPNDLHAEALAEVRGEP